MCMTCVTCMTPVMFVTRDSHTKCMTWDPCRDVGLSTHLDEFPAPNAVLNYVWSYVGFKATWCAVCPPFLLTILS